MTTVDHSVVPLRNVLLIKNGENRSNFEKYVAMKQWLSDLFVAEYNPILRSVAIKSKVKVSRDRPRWP